MIVLLGAELTQVFAHRRKGPIEPEPGAVEVREQEQRGRAVPAES